MGKALPCQNTNYHCCDAATVYKFVVAAAAIMVALAAISLIGHAYDCPRIELFSKPVSIYIAAGSGVVLAVAFYLLYPKSTVQLLEPGVCGLPSILLIMFPRQRSKAAFNNYLHPPM